MKHSTKYRIDVGVLVGLLIGTLAMVGAMMTGCGNKTKLAVASPEAGEDWSWFSVLKNAGFYVTIYGAGAGTVPAAKQIKKRLGS